ncbi:hypothetical protein BGX38DRAFT_1257273 [Terfezia claveryi]|nr:hypothetical protein BGX38DRAFT_1257273 [Terfezia claveryi]
MFSQAKTLRLQMSGGVLLQQRWMSNTIDERVAKLERSIQGQIDGLERKNEGLTSEIKGLKSEIKGLTSEIKGLKSEIKGLERKNEGLERKNEGLERKNEGLTSEIKGLTSEIKGLKSESKGLKWEIKGFKSELSSIFKSTVLPLHKAVILKAIMKEICNMKQRKIVKRTNKRKSKFANAIFGARNDFGHFGLRSQKDMLWLSNQLENNQIIFQ